MERTEHEHRFQFSQVWRDDDGQEHVSEPLMFPVRGDRNRALVEAKRQFDIAKDYLWVKAGMNHPGVIGLYEVTPEGLHKEVIPGHDQGQDDSPGGREYYREQLAKFLSKTEVPQ